MQNATLSNLNRNHMISTSSSITQMPSGFVITEEKEEPLPVKQIPIKQIIKEFSNALSEPVDKGSIENSQYIVNELSDLSVNDILNVSFLKDNIIRVSESTTHTSSVKERSDIYNALGDKVAITNDDVEEYLQQVREVLIAEILMDVQAEVHKFRGMTGWQRKEVLPDLPLDSTSPLFVNMNKFTMEPELVPELLEIIMRTLGISSLTQSKLSEGVYAFANNKVELAGKNTSIDFSNSPFQLINTTNNSYLDVTTVSTIIISTNNNFIHNSMLAG